MPDMILKALNRLAYAETAALLAPREGPCLSFFLPTSPADGYPTSTSLLLRNLLDQATAQVAAQGQALFLIEQLLAPLTTIANAGELWRYQQKGLAFFVAPQLCLGYRLPLALPACVVVDHAFYIKPLLPIIDGEYQFYLLALSQKAVRLFHGDRYQMTEMALADTPTSLAAALQYDEFERTLQLHSAGSRVGQGRRPAIFHGQGIAGDETIVHANLLRFFHDVERTVTNRLSRTHAPLILAGVDADQGLYRQVNHYPHLLPQGIAGNYDRAMPAVLHELAWPLVAPYFAQACDHALARYHQLAGQGDGHTVTDIKNVVLASVYHQVDTIFVRSSDTIWGKFIPEGHQVVVHKEDEPGDEELINLAVIHTLQNHGRAYLLTPEQMPEPTPVAAILRH